MRWEEHTLNIGGAIPRAGVSNKWGGRGGKLDLSTSSHFSRLPDCRCNASIYSTFPLPWLPYHDAPHPQTVSQNETLSLKSHFALAKQETNTVVNWKHTGVKLVSRCDYRRQNEVCHKAEESYRTARTSQGCPYDTTAVGVNSIPCFLVLSPGLPSI